MSGSRALPFSLRQFCVRICHNAHELSKASFWLPTKGILGFFVIADEKVYFSRAKIAGVNFEADFAGFLFHCELINTFASEFQFHVEMFEGEVDELANCVGFIGRADVIVGLLLLENAPHGIGIFGCVAPITFGIDISHDQAFFEALLDSASSTRDFASDKGFASSGRFVVKENSIRSMNSVGLAIINDDPEGVELGNSVGRAWIERSLFGLRHLLYFSVEFAGGRLIKAGLIFQAHFFNRIEES